MTDSSANVTHLLRAAASGDRRDVDVLMAAIYGDLRRLAMSHMQAERDDHTLQPTPDLTPKVIPVVMLVHAALRFQRAGGA